jgi:hypothetical protein
MNPVHKQSPIRHNTVLFVKKFRETESVLKQCNGDTERRQTSTYNEHMGEELNKILLSSYPLPSAKEKVSVTFKGIQNEEDIHIANCS